MTKRELNYILYKNPRLAFRLIEPNSHFKVGTKYLYAKMGRNAQKQRTQQFNFLLNKEIELILFGDNIGKAKTIIN